MLFEGVWQALRASNGMAWSEKACLMLAIEKERLKLDLCVMEVGVLGGKNDLNVTNFSTIPYLTAQRTEQQFVWGEDKLRGDAT